MAFTLTNRGTVNAEYQTNQSVAAFTPAADSVLIAWCLNSALADPTVSGHGTWTKIAHHDLGARLYLAWCAPGSSPSSAAVQFSSSSLTAYSGVIEISGDVDDSAPIVQSGSNAQAETDPPVSMAVSMSAIGDVGNLGLVIAASPDTGSTFTPQNSWSELFDSNVTGPGASAACQYLEGSVDVDVLQTGVYRNTIAVGVEIAAAGGATITGSGAPSSAASSTSGTSERELTSSGTPAAQATSASGTGERELTCSGTLQSAVSTVSGTAALQLKLLLTSAEARELRDENGALVANLANIQYEWYDKDTDTSGAPDFSGTFSTNASGEATIQLPGTALTAGQFGLLVLEHPTDNTIRGIYRIPVS